MKAFVILTILSVGFFAHGYECLLDSGQIREDVRVDLSRVDIKEYNTGETVIYDKDNLFVTFKKGNSNSTLGIYEGDSETHMLLASTIVYDLSVVSALYYRKSDGEILYTLYCAPTDRINMLSAAKTNAN